MPDLWLYRAGDLILGPVPPNQIVEKIYSHELDGKSEVQLMGSGSFRRLFEVESFRVHLAKADVKKKVDRDADSGAKSRARRRNILLGITAGVLTAVALVVVVVGNYLAVHTPGKNSDDAFADMISVDAPTVTRAKAAGSDDELVDYVGPNGVKRPVAVRDPKVPRPVGDQNKPKPGEEDPDGMSMGQVDQAGINDVVKKHQRSLFPCLAKVAKPGMALTKVPIEFSVANGKVSKLWVDNPDYKTGELPDCLMEELKKWPFKETQNATVGLSFNIGKKG